MQRQPWATPACRPCKMPLRLIAKLDLLPGGADPELAFWLVLWHIFQRVQATGAHYGSRRENPRKSFAPCGRAARVSVGKEQAPRSPGNRVRPILHLQGHGLSGKTPTDERGIAKGKRASDCRELYLGQSGRRARHDLGRGRSLVGALTMATVQKREWTTRSGKAREAWIV